MVTIVLTAALTLFIHVPYVIGRIHLVVSRPSDAYYWEQDAHPQFYLPQGDISVMEFPARGLFAVAKWITIATDYIIKFFSEVLDIVLMRPLRNLLSGGSPHLSQVDTDLPPSSSTLSTIGEAINACISWVTNLLPPFLTTSGSYMWQFGQDGLATLGSAYLYARRYMQEFAVQNTSFANFVAIVAGYMDIVGVITFLSALGEPILGRFGRAVTEATISHGVVIKVCRPCISVLTEAQD